VTVCLYGVRFGHTFDVYSLSAKYNKIWVGEEGVEKTVAVVVFE